MRWKHLIIAVSILAGIGCGASVDDAPPPAAATDSDPGHDHDHGSGPAHDHGPAPGSDTDLSTPLPEPVEANEPAEGARDQVASPGASEDRREMPAVTQSRSTGLAAHHEATTLVGSGDALPPLTVQDLDGNEVSVASLVEDARAVVLVIWDSQIDLSKLELEYLEKKIATPQAEEGVRVVGVNRGESADVVRQVAEEHGVSFPMLLDPDQSAFEQLATKTVPRTYVVDSQGKVRNLWVGFTGNGTISEIQKEIDAVLAE